MAAEAPFLDKKVVRGENLGESEGVILPQLNVSSWSAEAQETYQQSSAADIFSTDNFWVQSTKKLISLIHITH